MKRETISIADFLKEKGIKTNVDLNTFIAGKRVQLGLPYASKYSVLVQAWGESIADKVMRLLEVASWEGPKNSRVKRLA